MGIGPIQSWLIKESCFKSNPENRTTLISDYRITSFSKDLSQGEAYCVKYPNFHFQFQLLERNGLGICFSESTSILK
jgi:hypothetical protein